ncbi:MAG: hypothetical protein IKE94_07915 [Aeriscardovia sp.]|nr:hypothetical protein [Aeriscardovia sp.]
MTEEEIIICKEFLNDADATHSCNEYKLLMALLEQEPKSEWQKDHEIQKAYSDGANEVLDEIRAEIKHFMFDVNANSSESDYACNYILNILDKIQGRR